MEDIDTFMNIFRTAPKFIYGYMTTKKLNRILRTKGNQLHEEGRYEEEKALIWAEQKQWIELVAERPAMTYEVTGEENIPEEGPFMIYSNHQSFADIPAILWLMKDHGQIGFVSKEEWRKYKVLYDAVTYTRSIFLSRDNPRDAIKAIGEAKELLGLGFNLAIFPEGTRSKGHQMGEFKPAAFKFAEKAKVPILPVTLDGGYHLFEETGSYQPCHTKITVHPLVHIENLDKHEQKHVATEIEATIRSALD